jgi:hypothetical protein
MAELLVGGELALHLSGTEKLQAVHGDLRAPRGAVRSVEVLDDREQCSRCGQRPGTTA